MKVAAVQLGLHRAPARAVAEAESMIMTASRKGARLICLPEHWLGSRVLVGDDEILRRFTNLAERLDVYLNLGANYEKRGRKVQLVSQTVSPDGRISRQSKVHLYLREKKVAVPGSRFELTEIDGVRTAVLVCHDVVFPETARTVTLMGAELLLVPSLIVAKGSWPWLAYLRSRSLENRIPIVSPNAYRPPRFMGGSCIIDLSYDRKQRVMELVEETAPRGKTVIVKDIDTGSKKALRDERLRELFDSGAIEGLHSASKLIR